MSTFPRIGSPPAGAPRPRARGWIALALLVAMAASAALMGCERNVPGALLLPTGEQPGSGVLAGTVDFGDGSHPATLVLVARVISCTSIFSSIQVVGSPTGFNIGQSPQLTPLAPCMWIDTVSVPAGHLEWKFITNGDFDTTPDYGSPGAQTDGLEGTALLGAAGGDGNMIAEVPAGLAGVLIASLDESPSPARYSFKKPGPGVQGVFTSTGDGSFAIEGLAAGTYNVLIRPPGRAPRTITNVGVGNGPSNLGTISFGGGSSTGSISGTIAFDPTTFPELASPPYPPVTVQLFSGPFLAGTVTTTRNDASFSFGALAAGSYRLVADARLFTATTRDTIEVAGAARILAPITLPFEFTELSSQINLAGDFNGFAAPDAGSDTEMAQETALGLFVYPRSGVTPITIPAGTYNMKFVTDGSFDNPTDWGGDENVVLPVPITQTDTRLVSGLGSAIRIQIATTGQYRFLLDERRQTFTVEPITGPSRSYSMGSRR